MEYRVRNSCWLAPLVTVLLAFGCERASTEKAPQAPSQKEPTQQSDAPAPDVTHRAVPRASRTPHEIILPPVVFERNSGQGPSGFDYVVRGPAQTAGFDAMGFTLVVSSPPKPDPKKPQSDPVPATDATLLRMNLANANQTSPVGKRPTKFPVRQYDAKTGKHKKIPAFEELHYDDVYDGVDLRIESTRGRISYRFELEPNADLSQIRFEVQGAKRMVLDANGNLLIQTKHGRVTHSRPQFFERGDRGSTKRIRGDFIIASATEVGFQAFGKTSGASLVIDPDITFSSYTPGGYGDIAFGGDGRLFVTGTVPSTGWANWSSTDLQAYVWAVDPEAAEEIYLTHFQSTSNPPKASRGIGIAATPDLSGALAGVAYVTIASHDYDRAGSVHPNGEPSGTEFGYVAKMNADGTFGPIKGLGRITGDQTSLNVTYESAGAAFSAGVYIAGEARPFENSTASFGTPGALQETHPPLAPTAIGSFAADTAFVAKFDPNLQQRYFTYLGGGDQEQVHDIAVHEGSAYVVGSTDSADFPMTANPILACPGGSRSFAAKISPNGDQLRFGTCIAPGTLNTVDVADNGEAVIGGSFSIYPTNPELRRLAPNWQSFVYDISLPGDPYPASLAIDSHGFTHMTGTINEAGHELGYDAIPARGSMDMMYARTDEDGGLVHLSYLGGTSVDLGRRLAIHEASATRTCIAISGHSYSDDQELVEPIITDPAGGFMPILGPVVLYYFCELSSEVSLMKHASSELVDEGEQVAFIVTPILSGAPTKGTLVDVLDPSLELVSAIGINCAADAATNTVTCTDIPLEEGAPQSVVIVAKPTGCPQGKGGVWITNKATLTYGNDVAEAAETIFVSCEPPDPVCGDGNVMGTEECDDGNREDGDGCSAKCTVEPCGDGRIDRQHGEECDDGNCYPFDSCDGCRTVHPRSVFCGDGRGICPPCAICEPVECTYERHCRGTAVMGTCLGREYSVRVCNGPKICKPIPVINWPLVPIGF